MAQGRMGLFSKKKNGANGPFLLGMGQWAGFGVKNLANGPFHRAYEHFEGVMGGSGLIRSPFRSKYSFLNISPYLCRISIVL